MTDVMDRAAITGASRRVSFGDPVYAEVMDFVDNEADLLNSNQFIAWGELLADDMNYVIAGRETLQMKDGDGVTRDGMPAGARALKALAKRNETEGIYDRDPAPRQRRIVTNVKVMHTDKADEYAVKSTLLFLHTRQDEPNYEILTAERHDVVRRTGDGLRLARRRLVHDLTVLSFPIPNVIL